MELHQILMLPPLPETVESAIEVPGLDPERL